MVPLLQLINVKRLLGFKMEKKSEHRKQVTQCRHCKTEGLWYLSDGKIFWYTTKKNQDQRHICPDGEFRTWQTQYKYTPEPEEQITAEAEAAVAELFGLPKSKT